jgi:hypothetical protein
MCRDCGRPLTGRVRNVIGTSEAIDGGNKVTSHNREDELTKAMDMNRPSR